MNQEQRYNLILNERNKGKSLREIGNIFNVTGERIRQIIKYKFKTYQCKVCKLILDDYKYFCELHSNKGYIFKGRDFNREKVRIRDNYTCQDCNKKWEQGTRRFDVHHLNGLCGKKSKGYDSVLDKNGLITLCHKCHFNRPEHKTQTKEFAISVSLGHKKRNLTKV